MIKKPLNPGDFVTITKKENSPGYAWDPGMDCTIGETGVINIIEHGEDGKDYGVFFGDYSWFYSESSLEFVDPTMGKHEYTPAPTKWVPTEQDYRECCGVWVDGTESKLPWVAREHVVPTNDHCISGNEQNLDEFKTRAEFDKWIKDGNFFKTEPIPEQCIPRKPLPPKPVEYYEKKWEWL